MLATRSPFDSEIACHAKLRSKYSFFAASICVKVSERSNQYFELTLCVTSNLENHIGRRRIVVGWRTRSDGAIFEQSGHGNIDTCRDKEVTKC